MTDPIRAIRYTKTGPFKHDQLAGSYYLDLTGIVPRLWFYCPSGCGALTYLRIGETADPETSPCWRWNGSLNNPDLTPGVTCEGCGWQGELRDGYWHTTPDGNACTGQAISVPEEAA